MSKELKTDMERQRGEHEEGPFLAQTSMVNRNVIRRLFQIVDSNPRWTNPAVTSIIVNALLPRDPLSSTNVRPSH